MITVKNPVGRLVTYRVIPPVDDSNAAAAASEIGRAILGVDGRAMVCSDLSAARTFSGDATGQFIALMRSTNAKIARSALLVSGESPTLALQIERMLREAANPHRRAFREAASLRAWLSQSLSAEEDEALAAFLAPATDGVAASAPPARTRAPR